MTTNTGNSLLTDKNFRLFVELLRCGITGEAPQMSYTDADWMEIWTHSKKQLVYGVVWDGIQLLPTTQMPPETILLHWYAQVVRLENLNHQTNKLIAQVYHDLEGIPTILLKGAGTGALYPNPLHRSVGDIDIYTGSGYDAAQAIFRSNPEYIDSEIPETHEYGWTRNDITIENHNNPSSFNYPSYKKAWKQLVSDLDTEGGIRRKVGELEVLVPPAWFEIVYGVIHFARHLVVCGIGLKQLCDWAVIVRTHQNSVDWQKVSAALKSVGVDRVAGVMSHICIHHLHLLDNKMEVYFPLPPKLYRTALYALQDMMQVGNFGQYHELPSHTNPIRLFASRLYHHFLRQYSYLFLTRKEDLFRSIYRVKQFWRNHKK